MNTSIITTHNKQKMLTWNNCLHPYNVLEASSTKLLDCQCQYPRYSNWWVPQIPNDTHSEMCLSIINQESHKELFVYQICIFDQHWSVSHFIHFCFFCSLTELALYSCTRKFTNRVKEFCK